MNMPDEIPVGQVVDVEFITHDPTTQQLSDATGLPTFDVFNRDAEPGILGVTDTVKRDGYTGQYRVVFTLLSANFTPGNMYSLVVTATVGGKTQATSKTFRVVVPERKAGKPEAAVRAAASR